MEALVCKKLGDPALQPLSSPDSPIFVDANQSIPKLTGPTSVLVKIKATSLNYANYLQILGQYQEKAPLPFVPGSDYSGVVEAVGPGVSGFVVGDRVCSIASFGTFAQFIVTEEKELFKVPEGCDLVAAGALPVVFGTSYVALINRAGLRTGQVLLVLGAGGGVGISAVQIGKLCGATVIAVARGAEKVQSLRSLGADHVIDTSNENLTTSVKKFLNAKNLKGVDVMYDPVGGKLTKESMKLLNWGAQILVIGFASGEVPVIPANIALVKNWTVHGLYWGSYKLNQLDVFAKSVNDALSWLAKGSIKINISHAFPLQESNLAFAAIKDRKVIGKVMVICDGSMGITSKM